MDFFDKTTTALTPIWLISVGVALGMVCVLLLCGLFFVVSRIPVIGKLADSPKLRNPLGIGLGIVFFILAAIWIVPSGLKQATDGINAEIVSGLALTLLLALPTCFLCSYALIFLSSQRAMDELAISFREGVLYWLSVICTVLTGFAVLGILLAWVNGFGLFLIVRDPLTKLESYPRTFVTGRTTNTYEIDYSEDEDSIIPIRFDGRELQKLEFSTEQELLICAQPITTETPIPIIIRVPVRREGEVVEWTPSDSTADIIPEGPVEQLHVRNMGTQPTTLSITIDTSPEYGEVRVITTAAFCVIAVFLLYLIQRSAMPKVSAIALSTFKTEISQSVFFLMLFVGSVLMVILIYLPYNTFGDDIKMLKDSGLTIILLMGIFMAVWAASKSVADEIDGRTALTVLSKPVSRRSFLIGKFLGISWAIALLFIVIGLLFLITVSYKPVYDAVETAEGEVLWQTCHAETMQIIPGLVLAWLEAIVFVSISIAISTRLQMMPNFLICFAIYVLGHLTPLMVQSSVATDAFEGVVFFGQFIAAVVPVLDHYNIEAAVAGATDVPVSYLIYAFFYTVIYGTIAMLLALVFFEDRDLA